MNEVEKTLFRTRKTIRQACSEAGYEYDENYIQHIEQCSSCSIWLKPSQLKLDLDDNFICTPCWVAYGD